MRSSSRTLAVDEEDAPASARKTIVTAVLINLLNLAWMRRAFAGSFVALGAKLALTRNS